MDRSTTPNSVYSQPPSTSDSSPPEFQLATSPQDVYLRRLPFVNTALKSYDYAKNNSRVVKFGAEMVESSVKTISKPVINRLPGAVTNRVSCCPSLRPLPTDTLFSLATVFATRVYPEFFLREQYLDPSTLPSHNLTFASCFTVTLGAVCALNRQFHERGHPAAMRRPPHINCLSHPHDQTWGFLTPRLLPLCLATTTKEH